PIDIDREHMIIHKIIVAHGAKDACERFSDDNVYGSLAITYGDTDGGLSWPFYCASRQAMPNSCSR
ncbi:MAG: hypothetical protein M5U07_14080, partial [Xanthobacteraceae bacterium]|nr:hypothetical protein [Xanthobacteraceae bacterium]